MRLSGKLRQWCAPRYCAEAMEPRVMLAASLVKDLNTSGQSGNLQTLGHIGNVAIFAESDVVHGYEPFRSDGTEVGTFLLRDINPGRDYSALKSVASVGSTVFFAVFTRFNDGELWKTDGTVAGTMKLASVLPTTSHVVVGSELFFLGTELLHDGNIRTSLWKSDGSSAGTVRLSGDVGAKNAPDDSRVHMGAIGGKVFFVSIDNSHGNELWRSDGTPEGTKLFADLEAGPHSSNPFGFVATSDRLYFLDNIPGSKTQDLWKTDGTSVRLVATANKTEFDSIADLTALGDRLYFVKDDTNATAGLDSVWRTTGKSTSLVRVAKIVGPTILASDPNGPAPDRIYVSEGLPNAQTRFYSIKGDTLTPVIDHIALGSFSHTAQVGNDLYIAQSTSNSSSDVFRANAEDGKVLLKHFPDVSFAGDFTGVGSKVYFDAFDPSADISVLWLTDGTANGTVKDASFTGLLLFRPDNTLVAGNRYYFEASTQQLGTELWISNGRPGGVHPVRDIDPSTADSDPQLFTAGIGGTYFGANSGIYLYTESTRKVTFLAPISGDAVQFIGKVGAVEVIAFGFSLWRSDGTKAGTRQIFAHSFGLRYVAIAGGTLYFSEYFVGGQKLFKSDGTAGGTKQFMTNLEFGAPGVALNNRLIFSGVENDTKSGLWSTDGTVAGTIKLANLTVTKLFRFGGAVYFFASGQDDSQDLWRTDGTAMGTKLIKAGLGAGNEVAVAGDSFYFYNGAQLWQSDGSSSGTKLLKQFPSVQIRSVWITAVGKRVYFPGFDSTHGFELWTSFGGQTVLLKDIQPGSRSSVEEFETSEFDPDGFVALDSAAAPNGKLYFVADDGKHGHQLWETDATPTGTKRLTDIQPGKFLMNLAVTGDTLLFSAYDGFHGQEPWQLPLG